MPVHSRYEEQYNADLEELNRINEERRRAEEQQMRTEKNDLGMNPDQVLTAAGYADLEVIDEDDGYSDSDSDTENNPKKRNRPYMEVEEREVKERQVQKLEEAWEELRQE